MLSVLRPYVKLLRKALAWPYIKLGVSPTAVGAFGVALAIVAALCQRIGWADFSFWCALLAASTDMADGEVARVTKRTSPKGNYLDALGDRTREGILLFGLLPLSPNLVFLAILGTCLTSFAKARLGLVLIMDNRDWPGFGDHADRAVLLLIAYLLSPNITWPLLVLVVGTWSCFIGRARQAMSLIEEAPESEVLPYLRS